MIVDCETHVFKKIHMPEGDFHRCQVEHLIADMDRCGVDKTFLMAYTLKMLSSPGSQFPDPTAKVFGDSNEEVMEYFVQTWQKHKDRFFFFNITDPRQPDCIDVLEEQYNLGLQGLGETQPGYQYLMPNSPEFMRVYRFAADRELPLVLTMEGWDQFKGYFPSHDFDPYFDMMESVIREFKEVRFMLGHGGNCGRIVYTQNWDEYLAGNLRCYRLAAEVDNLWICSTMPWWIRANQINPFLPRLVEFLRKHVGFSRVCWGSDWPWAIADISFNSDYKTVVDFYRNFSPCTEEELNQLLGKSAYAFITGEKG